MIGSAALHPVYAYRMVAVLDYAAAQHEEPRDLRPWGNGTWLVDYRTDDATGWDEPGVRWALLDLKARVLKTNHPLWRSRIGHKMNFKYFR